VPIEPPVLTPCTAVLADGSGVQLSRMMYRDPASQAVLRGIFDTAVTQAIGRGRPFERTADNPLVIDYWGNIGLPFPVASIARLRPVTKIEEVIATGIVPLGGAGMHLFHPTLIPSADAGRAGILRHGGRAAVRATVRQAAGRWREPTDRVLYQAAGQGQWVLTALVRRDLLAGFEADVRRAFSAGLARWEVYPFSDGRLPPKIGEDRDARLQNNNRVERNDLRRSVPVHLMAASTGAAAASPRAPPDG
jgi:hypothetical protein